MRLAFTFTLTLARFVSDSILGSFACYCARYSYAACDAQRRSEELKLSAFLNTLHVIAAFVITTQRRAIS